MRYITLVVSSVFIIGLIGCEAQPPTVPAGSEANAFDPSFSMQSGGAEIIISAFTVNEDGEMWEEKSCEKRDTWHWVFVYPEDDTEEDHEEDHAAEDHTEEHDTTGYVIQSTEACGALSTDGKEMFNGGVVSVFVAAGGESKFVNNLSADFNWEDVVVELPSDGYVTLKSTPKPDCELGSWWINGGESYVYTSTYTIDSDSGIDSVWGMFMCGQSDGGGDDGGDDDGGDTCVICED